MAKVVMYVGLKRTGDDLASLFTDGFLNRLKFVYSCFKRKIF